MFNLFTDIPSDIIFFFYGAAFLFLGASIAMKDMRSSELSLARSLWLLGMFGFTHGVHEWLRMYPLIAGDHLTVRDIFTVNAAALVLFVASYLFLLQFGSALIRAVHLRRMRWLSMIPAVLTLLWIAEVARYGFTMDLQFIRHTAIGARHTFGLAGGMMTAYGLVTYSREVSHLSRFVSRNLHCAGVTFVLYAVFAGIFSSDFRFIRLPIPVEILRSLCAVMITYFIIRALNIFDIEMRKSVEQQARRVVQAEKLTSLGKLAAGIAHEINNPLTNASLAIHTLRSKLCSGAGADVVEKLNAVEKNIDRAAVIAQELLHFSRQKESEFIPLNINNVISSSLTLMKHKLKAVAVEQNLALVPDIMGDAGKLEQVFINVLSNALEAMPEGGRISISSSQRDGMVEVNIADTGVGIAEENLSRVFDPFFTTKEVGSGTGLGLSITYGIIQQHHGLIKLSSAVGQGTTVTIKIPAREKS
jgi:signal transduction histidine kinase